MAKLNDWLEPNKLLMVEAWARDGYTDEEIFTKMGISNSTFYEWKKKSPEFNEALKRGKEVVDIEVENALYKKCIGYTVPIKKTFKLKRTIFNDDGKKIKEYEELVEGEDEVYVPADTISQIFWLKNRKPKEWREKIQYEGNQEEINKVSELLNKIREGANNEQ